MTTLQDSIANFSSAVQQKYLIKASQLLEDIYAKLRGKRFDQSSIAYIPGIHFSYISPEASTELYDLLYNTILSSEDLMAKIPTLCSEVICQIAAYDFQHFVDVNFPKLLTPTFSTIKKTILAITACIILDPVKGFLCNAPKSPKNNFWKEEQHRYVFFGEKSSEFETPFGKSLIKMRQSMYDYILIIMKKLISNYKDSSIQETFFVPSFTSIFQTIIIPQAYRTSDIACGFPTRLEVLLAMSQYQGVQTFSKSKSDKFTYTTPISKQYSELSHRLASDKTDISYDLVKFSQPFDFSDDVDVQLYKLLLFLNLNESTSEPPPLMQLILYIDAKYSAFFLSLAQQFFLAYPYFSFSFFDDVFKQTSILNKYTPEQIFSFFHMLMRLVDVLACLPQRYLDDNQIEQLNAIGLLGLGSSYPRIRQSSYKLIETLGHFEAGDDKVPLFQILQSNTGIFEEFLLSHIEKDPILLMSRSSISPIMPLPMLDALLSSDNSIWRYMYVAIGIFAAENFSEMLLILYKQMAIPYISQEDPDPRNEAQIINVMSFLSALAETPLSNFGEQEALSVVQDLTIKILDKLAEYVVRYANKSYKTIRVLLGPLNISSFPTFLNMMNQSGSNDVVALALRSMAWNLNFNAISEHQEFFSVFLSLYIKNFTSFEWYKLLSEFVPDVNTKYSKIVNDSIIIINECLMTGYKLFSVLHEQHKQQASAPFPICDLVVDRKNGFLQKIQPLGNCLINLSRIKSSKSRLQTYSIATLTQWTACCKVDQVNFLMSNEFYEIMPQFEKSSSDMLLHILSHHFELLFGQYLQWALKPGYSMFFSAICSFFKAPTLARNTLLSDILKTQWISCININQSSPFLNHLQVIYENSGTLILCCLFYMNMPELNLTVDSFVLLASLVPVLTLFHMNGRADEIPKLFTMFLNYSEMLEQNTGCLDSKTILEISSILSHHFSYCMEALMLSCFDHIPKNNQETVERTLRILLPWFKIVQFDLEDRVISNQTEILFLKFSCFSFIDKLMNSFKHFTALGMNSAFFDVWKTLITEDNNTLNNNFVPIELSILFNCQNYNNHVMALPIIQYLYRMAPYEIVSLLCDHLSLDSFYYGHVLYLTDKINNISHTIGLESSDSKDNDLYLFIYKALTKLVLDSFQPIIQKVPLIFASCVIFFGKYQSHIKELLITILEAFKPIVNKKSSHLLLEAIQYISSISTFHRLVIDRSEITRNLTNFLISYNDEMAVQFGHEILKWILCCGDVSEATNALECYQGNLIDTSMLVVGLFSRSLWTINDAIPIIYKYSDEPMGNSLSNSQLNLNFMSSSNLNLNSSNTNLALNSSSSLSSSSLAIYHFYTIRDYTRYMANILNTLGIMAPKHCSPVDHTVLWLALASLERNNSASTEVFNAALNLILIFVTPQYFALLAKTLPYFLGNGISEQASNNSNRSMNSNSNLAKLVGLNSSSSFALSSNSFYGNLSSTSSTATNNSTASGIALSINPSALPNFPMYSESTFWRYHQPWGDIYHGALFSILDFDGPADIDLIISVINRLIQTRYMPLLSDSPCGIYIALLALLPWMWYVATNEISRFMYDSPDVQNMEMTTNALETLVENKEIVESLSTVFLDESVDLFIVLESVSDLVIPLVDDEGIQRIGHFYAMCCVNSKNSFHIPIYSISSKILKYSTDKPKTAKLLTDLSNYIIDDTKSSRKLYVDVYLKELQQVIGEEAFLNLKSSRVSLHETGSHVHFADSSFITDLKNVDSDLPNEKEITFADVPMYERIVAINIPHLYEVDANGVLSANFNDLNSFPPLLPNNSKLLKDQKFASIYNLFKKFKCEPFTTYTGILNKLHTSLVDVDALNVMKLCEKISYFPVNDVFMQILQEMQITKTEPDALAEEEVYEMQYQMEESYEIEQFITEATDPYEFVLLLPTAFIPTIDEMNLMGQDLIEVEQV